MAAAGRSCDVLVIGSGGAGLTAAVTARKAGLDVIVVEKQDVFGGTTATSGGMLWIPGNRHSLATQRRLGITDTIEDARAYLLEEAGNYADVAKIDSYLRYGPEMVDFLEDETEVKFSGAEHPDYHMHSAHSSKVRSIASVDYHARELGSHFAKLKGELPQTLFLGFAIGSSVEMKQFLKAGRSIKAFAIVARKMTRHFYNLLRYGRGEQVVRGRALIARLARTLFDLDVPILLATPALRLIHADGRVGGAVVRHDGAEMRIVARCGVVLASGGYPHDAARREATYPDNAFRTDHRTPANPGNVGDGARMAQAVGGAFSSAVSNVAAWMPVSVRPGTPGFAGVWPHLIDRLKPGFIAVTPEGVRFGDESSAYHDFVPALLRATAHRREPAFAWVIADKAAVDRWGIGFVRPWPVPRGQHVRSGYLIEAPSIAALAARIGVAPGQLSATVAAFNDGAIRGVDPDFQRGDNAYDLYQGDEEHEPNPCLGPLEQAPFYAVRILPGEIGTFAGIRTDPYARVVDEDGQPVPGLYSVGNDQVSVFGGAYPGAGSTLGPGLTFGYVAGRHLAGLIPDDADARQTRAVEQIA